MSRAARGPLAPAFLALVVAATGCSSLQANDRSILLHDALFSYNSAMRWGHLNTANAFLRAPDGTPLAGDQVFRDDIRVTGYRVVNRQQLDETRVRVLARLEYMSAETGQINTVDDTQLWWFDPGARRWFLDGGLPEEILTP